MSACTEACNRAAPGGRMEHCKVCHESFASTEGGDSHRIGDHGVREGPNARRCRTPQEMGAMGMWMTLTSNNKLVWHGRANQAGVQRRWNAADRPVVTNLTAS